MRPTSAELISRLMEVTGASSIDALAKDLGIPVRTVQRWATATAGGGPGYATTIRLLGRAGWLDTSNLSAVSTAEDDAPVDLLQESVAALLEGQAEILEEVRLVRAGERRVRPRVDPGQAPRKPA